MIIQSEVKKERMRNIPQSTKCKQKYEQRKEKGEAWDDIAVN